MKANEFRDMTPSELNSKIESMKLDLFNLRFKLGTGQLENTNQVKKTKRDIARALTVMKELEAQEQ